MATFSKMKRRGHKKIAKSKKSRIKREAAVEKSSSPKKKKTTTNGGGLKERNISSYWPSRGKVRGIADLCHLLPRGGEGLSTNGQLKGKGRREKSSRIPRKRRMSPKEDQKVAQY